VRASGFAEFVAQFAGAVLGRLHGFDECGLDAGRVHGGEGRVGGAALGGDALAQHFRRFARRGRQRRCAAKGGHRQLVGLLGAQAHADAGLGHGFQKVKDIGRPGARQGGDGVELRLLLHPQVLAGGADHLFDQGFVAGRDGRAGVERGHALTDQGRGVGHGAHHAVGAQPAADAVGADAGCHRQVQRLQGVGLDRCGRFAEDLGLDGPHHQTGLRQRRAGGGQGGDAKVPLQFGGGLGKGFDHGDVLGLHALADQAADDGAGHVAAADECDVCWGVAHEGVSRVSCAEVQAGIVAVCGGEFRVVLPAMDYILAIDQGTTSSRAVVFDRIGQPVAIAQREFQQHFPQPGWVEHDATEIWLTQRAVMREVLQRAGISARQLRAIGLTNQRETTVLWDRRTGHPVAPAIVWQDRRTAARCDALRAQGAHRTLARKTGLVLDAYFSGTKLEWLLDHVPGARARAERGELAFGTVDSWLLWQLTGGRAHATDPSNASRTLLFNVHTQDWDDDLLALLRIPRSLLPQVQPSSGVMAETDADVLGVSVPVAGCAGDQQAALFGQACFAPGMAKNTYGTGCFMLMNTGSTPVASRNQLLTTVAWQGPAAAGARTAYALEGSVFMAGATVQWLRDGLQIIGSAAEVEALAASVPDTGDVFLVPAFAGLGTPDWDGQARGALVGMTRGTGRAHIARAALEAIALQVADVFLAMRADSGLPLTELRVDGGASRNDLLLQIQANVLGVPVLRSQNPEATALGAAQLAGLATGWWSDAAELSGHWREDRRFLPQWGDEQRTRHLARWRDAVARSRHWARV